MASEWREAYQNSQKEIERLSKELENIQQSVKDFKESFFFTPLSSA
ncbi:MAG: hypothetical protein KME46_03170 [Brasilonema angustatum HA4187-MV1]|nr:hypothetical protein [Brasilonema angustatum HA4187-MV1]